MDDCGKLNARAFVVVDDAACFYEPCYSSAIRIKPPYGSEVEVIKETPDWVLLRWVGKEAWSVRSHLENRLVRRRENQIEPDILNRVTGFDGGFVSRTSSVEYGPRGGRFTRTSKGYRRYF
jgi:hypothetical protein